MAEGVELPDPGLMSSSSVVPLGVPSVTNSSWPVAAVCAMNTTRLPTAVNPLGQEEACKPG